MSNRICLNCKGWDGWCRQKESIYFKLVSAPSDTCGRIEMNGKKWQREHVEDKAVF